MNEYFKKEAHKAVAYMKTESDDVIKDVSKISHGIIHYFESW